MYTDFQSYVIEVDQHPSIGDFIVGNVFFRWLF